MPVHLVAVSAAPGMLCEPSGGGRHARRGRAAVQRRRQVDVLAAAVAVCDIRSKGSVTPMTAGCRGANASRPLRAVSGPNGDGQSSARAVHGVPRRGPHDE